MLLYDRLAIAATYARLAPEREEAEMSEFAEVSAFAEHEDFSCNAKFDYDLKKRQLMNSIQYGIQYFNKEHDMLFNL